MSLASLGFSSSGVTVVHLSIRFPQTDSGESILSSPLTTSLPAAYSCTSADPVTRIRVDRAQVEIGSRRVGRDR